MTISDINPVELKVFLNHIYEFKKGVRQMVLYTTNKKYEAFAVKRLTDQKISYVIQPVGNGRINLFFGRKECIEAIRLLVREAAINGKVDKLEGMKENVICGHLIPAGTGQREFEKIIVGSKEEYDRILANKKTVLDYNSMDVEE